jgi:sugar phosphate isomerase/epimerase
MRTDLTRRAFLGRVAASTAGVYGAGALRPLGAAAALPDSTIRGVKLGIIAPYSFRGEARTLDDVLPRVVRLGLSWVELQNTAIEQQVGAPPQPPRPSRTATPEQAEAARRATEELRRWRLSTSMEPFRALRRRFEDAGVTIDIVKFVVASMTPERMSDEEVDYAFRMARTLGASVINTELAPHETKRLAPFAEKHKMVIGYHGHGAVESVDAFARPGSWEQAFFYSPFQGANVDIGHFTAGNDASPIPFIREYHDRITSLHVKDRRFHDGPAVPFGQGDVPIREVLRLMRDEGYPFQATIELEYPIPPGSTVMAELESCVRYCTDALNS